MKSIIKGWVRFAFLGLLFTAISAQATNQPMALASTCDCGVPTNVQKTGQTGNSVSFSWSAVSGASSYDVWYLRVADNYTSAHTTVTSTAATIGGLSAGRYVFYFSTNCGDVPSDIIILEDVVIL